MNAFQKQQIEAAKQAALEVLLHNAHGPFQDLPRTAGWGYPEPYTRDLMISMLGIAASGDRQLMAVARKVLKTLAKNQTQHGHIPSLVHEKEDRGASDTTPLFLLAVAIYRHAAGKHAFLPVAVRKALTWMEYQSPSDRFLVAQQPTSDWRDEQWVIGYGLFVNSIVYSYLRLLGQHERADKVRDQMDRFTITGGLMHLHVMNGLLIRHKPYYALWSYKIYSSERFDLLGNSLAILSGLASPSRSARIIDWIEAECAHMQRTGDLALNLPPNLFPFIRREDPDWRPRYKKFNTPGNYHNGGVWPFICGFYIAALVAAKKFKLAEAKLSELTDLVRAARNRDLAFGFNECFKAQNGKPTGQDWQTWSAAMYLYAARCVEERKTPFFDAMRTKYPAGSPR
jgi:glycosyl hydrolase family 100 (putative invertase)